MKTGFLILIALVASTFAQDTNNCPDGWDLHHPDGEDECKCFFFANENEKVTHDDAKILCESHGNAWLAEVDDGPGDNYWVVSKLIDIYQTKKTGLAAAMRKDAGLAGPHWDDQWWIGAKETAEHDEHTPGKWMWEHLKTEVTWFDWAPGEPNNIGGQQCMAFLRYMYGRDEVSYQWNDWDCNDTAKYICQKKCATSGKSTKSPSPPKTETTTQKNKQKTCHPTEAYASTPGMDEWCDSNCNHVPPYCPASHCVCN